MITFFESYHIGDIVKNENYNLVDEDNEHAPRVHYTEYQKEQYMLNSKVRNMMMYHLLEEEYSKLYVFLKPKKFRSSHDNSQEFYRSKMQ